MNSALFGLVAAVTWGIHDFIGRFASRATGQLVTTLGLALSGLVMLSTIRPLSDKPSVVISWPFAREANRPMKSWMPQVTAATRPSRAEFI